MTKIRYFTPNVRLKRLLAESGGLSETLALERAHSHMEAIRANCMVGLDEKIEAIASLASRDDEVSRKRCYDLSNDVFAIAGAYGLTELSEAAHSLCTLLSGRDAAASFRRSVGVHIDAMRALRHPEISGNQQIRARVLHELKALSSKLARDEGSSD